MNFDKPIGSDNVSIPGEQGISSGQKKRKRSSTEETVDQLTEMGLQAKVAPESKKNTSSLMLAFPCFVGISHGFGYLNT